MPGTIACQNLDFSFRSGVAFGGRGTAGGCFVTPCQGVFLIPRVSCGLVCVPGTIACQTLDFFIPFRSDVWPGQEAVSSRPPGCFPDLKGVLWLPARPLIDFFIRFRSDVWPGQRDGRRLFRHAVPGCFPDLKGVLWLGFCAWNSGSAGQTLDFFIRFRSDVWPGHRGGRRLFVTPCQGVFLI